MCTQRVAGDGAKSDSLYLKLVDQYLVDELGLGPWFVSDSPTKGRRAVRLVLDIRVVGLGAITTPYHSTTTAPSQCSTRYHLYRLQFISLFALFLLESLGWRDRFVGRQFIGNGNLVSLISIVSRWSSEREVTVLKEREVHRCYDYFYTFSFDGLTEILVTCCIAISLCLLEEKLKC